MARILCWFWGHRWGVSVALVDIKLLRPIDITCGDYHCQRCGKSLKEYLIGGEMTEADGEINWKS